MLKLSRRDFIETTLFDDGKILTINSLSRHADISIDEANELVYFVSLLFTDRCRITRIPFYIIVH